MDDSRNNTESLQHRLKNSICCCFRYPFDDTPSNAGRHYLHSAPTTPNPLLRDSSQRIKSLDFKEKCLNLVSRIGNNHHRRRRSQSVDFGYDPLSYALNFDDGDDDPDPNAQTDFYSPVNNFTARLPHLPPIASEASQLRVPALSLPEWATSDAVAERTARRS